MSIAIFGIPALANITQSSTSTQPTNQSIQLAWNPSTNGTVVGYNLYSGGQSKTYTNKVAVGNVNAASFVGVAGATLFMVITALDRGGDESLPSNEISYTFPGSPAGSTSILPITAVLPFTGSTNTTAATNTATATTTAAVTNTSTNSLPTLITMLPFNAAPTNAATTAAPFTTLPPLTPMLPFASLPKTVPASPIAATHLAIKNKPVPWNGLSSCVSVSSTNVVATGWALQASEDFKHWRTLQVGSNSVVNTTVITAGCSALFFRLSSL
jgi:hypothetical protein